MGTESHRKNSYAKCSNMKLLLQISVVCMDTLSGKLWPCTTMDLFLHLNLFYTVLLNQSYFSQIWEIPFALETKNVWGLYTYGKQKYTNLKKTQQVLFILSSNSKHIRQWNRITTNKTGNIERLKLSWFIFFLLMLFIVCVFFSLSTPHKHTHMHTHKCTCIPE